MSGARISVRTALLIIATVALCIWTARLFQLRRQYLVQATMSEFAKDEEVRASHFEGQAVEHRRLARLLRSKTGDARRAAAVEETVSLFEKAKDNTIVLMQDFCAKSLYYGRLAMKYRNAAARPWLSVAPDPPPPVDRHVDQDFPEGPPVPKVKGASCP
jgi:hypothetical protein